MPAGAVVVQDQPQSAVERVLDHHEVFDDHVHPRRPPRRQDVEESAVDGERRRAERPLQPTREMPAVCPRPATGDRGDRPGGFGPRGGPRPAAAAPGRTPGPRRTSPGSPIGRSRSARCPPRAASRRPSRPATPPGFRASGPRRPRRSARPRDPRCDARRTSGGPDPGRSPSPRSPTDRNRSGSRPSLLARRIGRPRPNGRGGRPSGNGGSSRPGSPAPRRLPGRSRPEVPPVGQPGRRSPPGSAAPGYSESSSDSHRGRSSLPA